MEKVLANIRYRMRYQFSWVGWYMIIYIAVMIMIFYPLIKYSLINAKEGSLAYRLWGLVVFQFAVTLKFKEDFNFFLTLSSTRREIFQSFYETIRRRLI